MMRLVRLFALDVRKGIVFRWKWFAACFVIVLALSLLSSAYAQEAYRMSEGRFGIATPFSFGDMCMSLFAGIPVYLPHADMPFNLPTEWLLVLLLAAFTTLTYPLQDLETVGVNVVAMCGSRLLWWLAKCLWVVASVVLFYAVAFAAMALATVLVTGQLSLSMTAGLPGYLEFGVMLFDQSQWDTGLFLLMVPCVLCAVCFIQLLASLFFGTLPAFALTVALLFFSAYYDQGILLGEYLMAARSCAFGTGGHSIWVGLALSAVFSLWAICHGAFLFSRMDVYAGRPL